MTKKIILTVAGLVVIALVILAIYFIFINKAPTAHKSGAQFQVPVTVTSVNKQAVTNTIDALGTTVAFESVTVTANVTEVVKTIYFEDGEFVKKGQLLVKLDEEEEQAKLDDANARLQNAEKSFDRTSKLRGNNFIAQSQHDQAVADLNSAKAKVNEIQATIADRTILAPFAGVLGFRKISPGALIQPGTPIVTIDQITPIKVDFTLSEKYFSEIYKDQQVEATSIAFPNKTFEGKIATINARIDPATRSFTVRANFPNQDLLLKPGLLLNIKIKFKPTMALVIPEDAIVLKKNKKYVFVVNKDNTVTEQPIVIGKRYHGKVTILQGLKAGDSIVLDGGFKLANGQQVNVVTENKKRE